MAKTKRDTLEQETGQPLPLPQSMGMGLDGVPEVAGRPSFFGAGVVMPDGTVQEFCGKGRTWNSVQAFHRERAGRAGNLILYFPAEAPKPDGEKKAV